MIVLINYADSKYEKARKVNSKTAYRYGKVDKVIEYKSNDIDEAFRQQNHTIFAYERGVGLWLWKPYIINRTLKTLKDGDFLMYTDSGSFFINKVSYLIEVMNRDNIDIMVFELPLLEKQFTKKEAFVMMEYENYEENQILGGYILLRKSEKSQQFVQSWLNYASKEELLSPNKFRPEIDDFECFISHREDQSVLSALSHKYNIVPYRDPSQYGIRPWQYAKVGRILKFKSYRTSSYPQILISNRGANFLLYKLIEAVKSLLNPILNFGVNYKCNE